MPLVGPHWKKELESPNGEVDASSISIDPSDILSVKRALKVLGSSLLPAKHRSLTVVFAYEVLSLNECWRKPIEQFRGKRYTGMERDLASSS